MASKIVVGYDITEPSDIALSEALSHASGQPGSTLHVLTVLKDKHSSPFPDIDIDYRGAAEVQERISELVHAKTSQLELNPLMLFVHVRIGDPAEQLLALAWEANADLIVVGTSGHGSVRRWLLGSVAETVMRHAHCPVLVARPKDQATSVELMPEPPCPLCVERRQETNGEVWWCEVHAKPYVPPHRYHYEQQIAQMQPDDQVLW